MFFLLVFNACIKNKYLEKTFLNLCFDIILLYLNMSIGVNSCQFHARIYQRIAYGGRPLNFRKYGVLTIERLIRKDFLYSKS